MVPAVTSRSVLALAVLLGLAACASLPTGPEVMALPGTGRSFDEFRIDDVGCREYAFQQIGGKAREQAANDKVFGSAATGAAVGALAGAAIGGRSGAGVGAGMGLIVGSASGSEAAQGSVYGSQRRYDIAYVQCMYGRGHRVPVSGNYTPSSPPPPLPPASSPLLTPPPPPPGPPPAPPPVR
jgi:hypothetical protein